MAPEIELAEDVELTVSVEMFDTDPPIVLFPEPELIASE
jgi:hypothetical protein